MTKAFKAPISSHEKTDAPLPKNAAKFVEEMLEEAEIDLTSYVRYLCEEHKLEDTPDNRILGLIVSRLRDRLTLGDLHYVEAMDLVILEKFYLKGHQEDVLNAQEWLTRAIVYEEMSRPRGSQD